MAYSIYLRRESPISLAEWKSVVERRTDVRLQTGPITFRNPSTAEIIAFPHQDGDTEVLVEGDWRPCFLWREGQITFGAPRDFNDPHSALRVIVREFVQQLSARAVGEEAEEYE